VDDKKNSEEEKTKTRFTKKKLKIYLINNPLKNKEKSVLIA
jgi:hypothetical protein